MAFPKDYEPEQKQAGDYTEIKPGENRLRFLSEVIVGNSLWVTTEDGKRKPMRKRYGQTFNASDIGIDKWGNPERIKQFMAVKVWNYTTQKVEVFETDKGTVIEALYNYDSDPDWGDLTKYDISIQKSGEGKDTRYQVIPKPAKALEPTITKASVEKYVNLVALYDGGNPFSKEEASDYVEDAEKALTK